MIDFRHRDATTAPEADMSGWQRAPFSASGFTYDVYRKGMGPGVIPIPEMPGLDPHSLALGNHLVSNGFTVVAIPPSADAATIARTPVPPEATSAIRSAPVVLVICLDLAVVSATDLELDRVSVVPGASVYPFVWNVLLAARNEGYGGVLTTAVVSEERAVKHLLFVPDPYAITAVVPLGKPVRQVLKLRRKPVAEFVTHEMFDGNPYI